MRELSIFIDESGDAGPGSRFYLLTLVFHDQSDNVLEGISRFERSLLDAELPNATFHFTPVLRGHDQFVTYSVSERKKFLSQFRIFTEKCPIRYTSFAFRKRDYADRSALANQMRKELNRFLQGNLAFMQKYDYVKIYYDNGQKIIHDIVHSAIEEAVSANAIVYKDAAPSNYRLFQVADYICGIELTAIRYENNEQGASELSFFGSKNTFKKNWLKKLRRKQMS